MENNNLGMIAGTVASEIVCDSHSDIVEFVVEVKRNSSAVDRVPVEVPQDIVCDIKKGDSVCLAGEVRTRNEMRDGKSRLIVYFYGMRRETYRPCLNEIHLQGIICKAPIYRTTPFGRNITDILLAVDGGNGKSYYVPCIAWAGIANIAKNLLVGDAIEIECRFQSREYDKEVWNGVIKRTAYEMSIFNLTELQKKGEMKL